MPIPVFGKSYGKTRNAEIRSAFPIGEKNGDSKSDRAVMNATGHNSKEQLRSIIERVERLEEEKKARADDIREVYAEAKGNGYDVKALRSVIRLRKQDKHALAEHEAIVETYLLALGDLATTPLGRAAVERATA